MGTPPTATTRDGAFLALALADALKLGLPDPDYITMHPHLAGRVHVSAIDFQFNGQRGRDPLPALRAWANRFGVTVRVTADSEDPASMWHKFEFTHAGVRFGAYAEIAAATGNCGSVAPYSLAECALPAGHDGRHESEHQPAIVWDPAAVLAATIDAGTTVIVEDDEAPTQAEVDRCGYSEDPYHRCRVCYDYAAGREREHPLKVTALDADEAANDPCARCDEPMGAHARDIDGGYLCPADVTASITNRLGPVAS